MLKLEGWQTVCLIIAFWILASLLYLWLAPQYRFYRERKDQARMPDVKQLTPEEIAEKAAAEARRVAATRKMGGAKGFLNPCGVCGLAHTDREACPDKEIKKGHLNPDIDIYRQEGWGGEVKVGPMPLWAALEAAEGSYDGLQMAVTSPEEAYVAILYPNPEESPMYKVAVRRVNLKSGREAASCSIEGTGAWIDINHPDYRYLQDAAWRPA